MGKYDKVLQQILRGSSDANVAFHDLRGLLLHLGFEERTRGSHHLFRKSGVSDRVNLQAEGKHAKPYQVRQVRAIIVKHKLAEQSDA